MAADEPLVSVGIPVYNGERFMRSALDSVLSQTYRNIEVVISDNASTDGTAAICLEYAARDSRIRYYKNAENIGMPRNGLRVFELASGKYFVWNCADDVRPQDSLAIYVKTLEAHPEAVMAHGPVHLDLPKRKAQLDIANDMDLSRSSAAERVGTFTHELQHNGMLFGLYRRDALARVFQPAHSGHDYLNILQTCLLGPIVYVPSRLITYLHVWGETHNPMYDSAWPSVIDLLFYQGVRRKKCWLVMVMGAGYLMTRPRVSMADRFAGAWAHTRAFVSRYHRQLLTELIYMPLTPVMWVMRPLLPAGRRMKGALIRHGMLSAATRDS